MIISVNKNMTKVFYWTLQHQYVHGDLKGTVEKIEKEIEKEEKDEKDDNAGDTEAKTETLIKLAKDPVSISAKGKEASHTRSYNL